MAAWIEAGTARRAFADLIEGLDETQLDSPTLCDEWTARQMLGHITSFADTSAIGFMKALVATRFNFDKTSVYMEQVQSKRSVPELLAVLREKADNSAPMPGFPEAMTSSDVTIHAQDVRRPLGIEAPPAETFRSTLDFVTTSKQATQLVHRKPIDAVTLSATDLDWSFGSGPEITGTAEAILMGMSDRPVLDELAGDGVAAWR